MRASSARRGARRSASLRSGLGFGAEKTQQLAFGAAEEAGHQLADGGAAHLIARRARRIHVGASRLAPVQLAFAHQAVEHGHDGGVGQRPAGGDDFPHLLDVALAERPQGVEAFQFERRRDIAGGFGHHFSWSGAA